MSAATDSSAKLAKFSDELARWGERMNLVGSTDPDAIARHVEDALAGASALAAGLEVVDLGSGAGFPGIPIAIARPDLRVTLVEIREKRVAFLRHAVRALELDVEVLRVSIESPTEKRFDRALLRAVAAPERAVQLGRPWVHASGEVWIWAGPGAELADSTRISLESGGAILRVPAAAISRGTP